jgi:hypothetical protein
LSEGLRAATRATAAANAPSSIVPSERTAAASDARQQAELDLAASILLGATDTQQAPVRDLIRSAEQAAHGTDATAALTAASRAFVRAEQLVRQARSNARVDSTPTQGAQLLTELSGTGGFEPRRDERGVVAVMRGLFGRGASLTPAANGRIATLARIFQSHTDALIRIEAYVGGADHARSEATATAQAQAIVAALIRAGVPQNRLQAAGLARVPSGARSDDRVEAVMVLPTEP